MTVLYEDGTERAKHREAIDRLVEESGAPESEVVKLYEDELGRMKSASRVQDFVPLLVTRQVKRRLRNAGR